MKLRPVTLSFSLALVLGLAAYVFLHYSVLILRRPATLAPVPSATALQAPTTGTQDAQSTIAPPPRPAGELPPRSNPEPRRILIGVTRNQLAQINQFLPEGSKV